MLQIVLGEVKTGKSAFLMEQIRRAVVSKQRNQNLLIPEQYSHEAERTLCSICPEDLSLYGEVFSFTRLATRVEEDVEHTKRKYLDQGGRFLTMIMAFEEVKTSLRLYKGTKHQGQLLENFLKTMDNLKQNNVTVQDLLQGIEQCDGSLTDKLHDMALIMVAYQRIVSKSQTDPAERLDILAENIKKSKLFQTGHFYIDGFTDFTAQEIPVIEALLQTPMDMTVCLTCDRLEGTNEIFSAARKTAWKLIQLAQKHHVPYEIVSMVKPKEITPLTFVTSYLFHYTEKRMESNGQIHLYQAGSKAEECAFVAAEILRILQTNGGRYRDFAIAVRGFDDYAEILESVFLYYNIPIYMSQKQEVLKRSTPAFLCAMMEIIAGGWEQEAMISYLKTGLTQLSIEEIDLLENYVYLWSIRGEKLWTQTEPWTMHPEGYGKEITPESQAQCMQVDQLRRIIAEPITQLKQKGRQAETAKEQAQALLEYMIAVQLPDTLETRANVLMHQEREALAMEYRQIWELMIKALEQCVWILGEIPMAQETFFALFQKLLSQYEVGTIPISLDRVTAGELDRMRRRNISHLFLLGASDDRIPRPAENVGIFTEEEKQQLKKMQIYEGDGQEEGLYREMHLIYQCLSLPAQTLTVTYAAKEGTMPAFVVQRIQALFDLGIQQVDTEEIKTYALAPALELYAQDVESEYARSIEPYLKASQQPEFIAQLQTVKHRIRGHLSKHAAKQLYGKTLALSASKAETLSACRFQYFMRYGLQVKKRKPAGFSPPEQGVFMHYVLEGVMHSLMQENRIQSDALDMKQIEEAVKTCVDAYVSKEFPAFRGKSPRFIYLFQRLEQSVYRVVEELVAELCVSQFEPLDFEIRFGKNAHLPPICIPDEDATIQVTGVVDRVDGYLRDGKLYLRVIDYKTGKKQFSLTDVWYGMGLQMLLYLFGLQKYGKQYYGKEVVPAGVLYVPARDVLISSPSNLSDEDIIKEKQKALRRSGLLLDDPTIVSAMEQSENPQYIPVKFNKSGAMVGEALASAQRLGQLSRHVEQTLREIARMLRRGCVDADPIYETPEEGACTYCDYRNACHFDEQRDHRRYMKKHTAEEIWEKLEKWVME